MMDEVRPPAPDVRAVKTHENLRAYCIARVAYHLARAEEVGPKPRTHAHIQYRAYHQGVAAAYSYSADLLGVVAKEAASMAEPTKPTVTGARHGDNIYQIMGAAARAMREAGGAPEDVRAMQIAIIESNSYDEAIAAVRRFVTLPGEAPADA